MPFTSEIPRFFGNVRYIWRLVTKPKRHVYHGVVIPVDATPELITVRRLIYRGVYEQEEMQSIARLVRADDIVVEFGAGCGVMTTFIAKRLKDSSNVHTYEANPRLLDSIKAVAEANGVMPTVNIAAASTKDEDVEFFVNDSFLSSSSTDRRGTSTKVRVKGVSVKRVIDELQPTFVVFDIEGAETVFSSIVLPDSVRAICGELHPHVIGDTAVSAIIGNFIGQGFTLNIDLCHGRTVALERRSSTHGQDLHRPATPAPAL